ncbi:hypothetical protein K443DRAFT_172926 [Laccaria amethystina LaAM-08-1]|uniref:Uncharacterized protein n=1 Tax=Laccaria amethystina LaAM-08-1 TaxID=1095629 RepID=A0A0C9X314_9AGAR|nr:hypothetical protein K443DRAFT_172926 [Laccaria amethystina LaAM-08-1]
MSRSSPLKTSLVSTDHWQHSSPTATRRTSVSLNSTRMGSCRTSSRTSLPWVRARREDRPRRLYEHDVRLDRRQVRFRLPLGSSSLQALGSNRSIILPPKTLTTFPCGFLLKMTTRQEQPLVESIRVQSSHLRPHRHLQFHRSPSPVLRQEPTLRRILRRRGLWGRYRRS